VSGETIFFAAKRVPQTTRRVPEQNRSRTVILL
jgi:hypothetical protein